MSTVQIKGLAQLQKFLDELPVKTEKNFMRSALRQGANVLKAESIKNLSANGNVKTRTLLKGIKVSTQVKGGKVTAHVKVKGKHSYLAHWIEYGVAAHGVAKGARRKSGKRQNGKMHPGFDPYPFMRPALDTKAQQALMAVGERIKQKLTASGFNTADIDLEIET